MCICISLCYGKGGFDGAHLKLHPLIMGLNINVGINPTFLTRSSVVRKFNDFILNKICESQSNSPLYSDHGKLNGSNINIFYFYFFLFDIYEVYLYSSLHLNQRVEPCKYAFTFFKGFIMVCLLENLQATGLESGTHYCGALGGSIYT